MRNRRFSNVELSTIENSPWYSGQLVYGNKVRLTQNDRLLLEKAGSTSKGIELYLDLLTDNQVFAAFDKQLSEICSKDWYFEPGGEDEHSKKAMEFVEEVFKNLCYFDISGNETNLEVISGSVGLDGLFKHLGIAMLTGISYAEVIWGRTTSGKIIPTSIKPRDPKRFILESKDSKVYLKLLTRNNPFDGIYVPSNKFIVHRFFAVGGDDPYGMGMGRFLYYPVQWKKQLLTLWLTIIDRHADPTAIGTFPRDAEPDEVAAFDDAITNIAREMSISMKEGYKMEFISSGLQNAEALSNLLAWCDTAISKVILGESSTSEPGGGSYARESITNDIRKMKAKALSDSICETLNQTLINWIVKYNYPLAKPPKIWRQFEDSYETLGLIRQLKGLGYTVNREYLESLTGIPLDENQKPTFV